MRKRDPIESAIRTILSEFGEDPHEEGIQKTPHRVAESLRFLTKGYGENVMEIMGSAQYQEEEYDEIVLVKDIEIFSLCMHHLLPFFGRCHIGYIPNGKIIGLSKLPRIVEVFS